MAITVSYYREITSKYKTESAKKAYMTREIKALRAHLAELKKAYNSPVKYYLGDKVTSWTITRAETDLTAALKFKVSLINKQ